MSDQASNLRPEPPPGVIDTRVLKFARRSIFAAFGGVGGRLLSLPAHQPIAQVVLDPAGKTLRAIYADGAVRMLDQSRIAAALIAYCIAARLPIARAADKSVDVTDSGITLRFVTTMKTPPRIKAA